MIAPDLVIKSKRKTLSLCVMKDGRVVVHAPTNAKSEDINRFIFDKQGWLTSKLAIIENNKFLYDDVINYKRLLFLGAKHKIYRGQGSKVVIGDDFSILLPSKIKDELNLI